MARAKKTTRTVEFIPGKYIFIDRSDDEQSGPFDIDTQSYLDDIVSDLPGDKNNWDMWLMTKVARVKVNTPPYSMLSV